MKIDIPEYVSVDVLRPAVLSVSMSLDNMSLVMEPSLGELNRAEIALIRAVLKLVRNEYGEQPTADARNRLVRAAVSYLQAARAPGTLT